MTQIYVSSTYTDLAEYRQQVYEVLRKMRYDVVAMEDYAATDERPLDKCLADVAASQVYVGIFAWRYGYVPPGQTRSITELEYRRAGEVGVERLIFLLHKDVPWPPSWMEEGQGRKKIEALRAELMAASIVQFFKSPGELAAQVAAAVSVWATKRLEADMDRLRVSPAQADRRQRPRQAEADRKAGKEPRRLRVFLCHSSGDKPAVRDLYRRLRADGLEPWLDEEELLPGQDWDREIRKAVRGTDVILVCLSCGSVTKAGYVQKEIKLALDIAEEQPEGTIFLVPLRLEECTVPERLSRWQWVNLFDAKGYERLIRALRVRAGSLGETLPVADEPVFLEAELSLRSEQGFREGEKAILEPDLVLIPAGPFLMGSTDADRLAENREKPQHTVELPDYYIGKYPVTNAEYGAFVSDTEHQPPEHWPGGSLPRGKERHPVVNISWLDAVVYCNWLARVTGKPYRLPTEAEWEKAARGPDGRIYPWGNEWDSARLNSKAGGSGDTTPVGRYSPDGDSPCGAADMAGNAWEWCHSLFKPYPYRVDDGREEPNGDGPRMVRGGSWVSVRDAARCASRRGDFPDLRWDGCGFRVVVPSRRVGQSEA